MPTSAPPSHIAQRRGVALEPEPSRVLSVAATLGFLGAATPVQRNVFWILLFLRFAVLLFSFTN